MFARLSFARSQFVLCAVLLASGCRGGTLFAPCICSGSAPSSNEDLTEALTDLELCGTDTGGGCVARVRQCESPIGSIIRVDESGYLSSSSTYYLESSGEFLWREGQREGDPSCSGTKRCDLEGCVDFNVVP